MSAFTSSSDMVARMTDRLAQAVGAQRYTMWFDRSAHFDFDSAERRLNVTVPNRFVAEWIDQHFQDQLREAVQEELGSDVGLQVSVEADLFTVASSANAAASSAAACLRPRGSDPKGGLAEPPAKPTPHSHRDPAPRLRHRLDDFIVGPSNELAFSAAETFSAEDAAPHTLFIHGSCGLGKTHLLHGICRRLLDRKADARVRYTTAEQFTNEFLAAMRTNAVAAFRHKVRRLDLLAVDDVHFLAGKTATQQEFLHSFDALELGGARVVLASDSHPKLIRQFSDALVSRCMRGLVAQIYQPDTATRVRIVRALAQRRRLSILDSVIEALAAHCQGSVREIEGTLTKLHALARLAGERRGEWAVEGDVIGHALMHRLLESERAEQRCKAITFDQILDTVSQTWSVHRRQIIGSVRHRRIVEARALAIHLARRLTAMSYPEIAAAMGRDNHSTIITAAQRVERELAAGKRVTIPDTLEELPLGEIIERLRRQLTTG